MEPERTEQGGKRGKEKLKETCRKDSTEEGNEET
jgi:hypothetical protein